MSFSGKRVEGETWFILLAVGDQVSAHGFMVTNDQSLADIAAGLAADIEAFAADDFTALADGDNLLIVNRAGDKFMTVYVPISSFQHFPFFPLPIRTFL